tara:strand:- start:175 stop:354 length:180 start_codon:yes stop_codon:yes gene_type:complete
VVKEQRVEFKKLGVLKKIIKAYKLINENDKKTISLLLIKLLEKILGLISKNKILKKAIR